MLKEALNLKEALSRFGDTYTMSGPTLDEWKQAQDVANFLEAFLDATKTFSVVRRPSSHTYVKKVWGIRGLLLDDDLKDNAILQELAQKMQTKFSKYWETPNLILTIATLFDPRYKLIFVRYCFQDAYGDEYEAKLDNVRTWLTKYYEEYEIFTSAGSATTTNSESSQSRMKLMGKKKLEMRFAQFQSENRHLLFMQNSGLAICAKPRREMVSLLYLFVLFTKIKKICLK
jgi:Domain of unknown function (DUF4413)